MNTPTALSTPKANRRSDPLDTDSLLLQSISVGALIATAVAIALTGTIDLCTSSGSILLTVAWLVLPVAGIAPIVGVAASTHRTPRRYLTATAAVGLTAMWLFGLVWAHVGEAINQVAC